MWTIEQIKDLDFELINNHNLWCHFRGHGFDVFVNLNTKEVKGNYFNFHAYKNSFKGHFRAILNNQEEFQTLLKLIV